MPIYSVLPLRTHLLRVVCRKWWKKEDRKRPRKQHRRQHIHVTQQLLRPQRSPKVMSLGKHPLGLMTHWLHSKEGAEKTCILHTPRLLCWLEWLPLYSLQWFAADEIETNKVHLWLHYKGVGNSAWCQKDVGKHGTWDSWLRSLTLISRLGYTVPLFSWVALQIRGKQSC